MISAVGTAMINDNKEDEDDEEEEDGGGGEYDDDGDGDGIDDVPRPVLHYINPDCTVLYHASARHHHHHDHDDDHHQHQQREQQQQQLQLVKYSNIISTDDSPKLADDPPTNYSINMQSDGVQHNYSTAGYNSYTDLLFTTSGPQLYNNLCCGASADHHHPHPLGMNNNIVIRCMNNGAVINDNIDAVNEDDHGNYVRDDTLMLVNTRAGVINDNTDAGVDIHRNSYNYCSNNNSNMGSAAVISVQMDNSNSNSSNIANNVVVNDPICLSLGRSSPNIDCIGNTNCNMIASTNYSCIPPLISQLDDGNNIKINVGLGHVVRAPEGSSSDQHPAANTAISDQNMISISNSTAISTSSRLRNSRLSSTTTLCFGGPDHAGAADDHEYRAAAIICADNPSDHGDLDIDSYYGLVDDHRQLQAAGSSTVLIQFNGTSRLYDRTDVAAADHNITNGDAAAAAAARIKRRHRSSAAISSSPSSSSISSIISMTSTATTTTAVKSDQQLCQVRFRLLIITITITITITIIIITTVTITTITMTTTTIITITIMTMTVTMTIITITIITMTRTTTVSTITINTILI
jgi:hypothetical protein